MKKVIVCLTLLLCLISLAAYETTLKIDPSGWQKTGSEQQLPVTIKAGEPMMPFVPVKILLPFGHKYSGAQITFDKAALSSENALFELARQQLPISRQENTASINVLATKSQSALFPTQDWEFLGTQYYRGFQLAIFNIYPYKYNPETHQLYTNAAVNIKINSVFDASEAKYQANFCTSDTETQTTLVSLVHNPEIADSYSNADEYRAVMPQTRIIDISVPKKMIIITNNERLNWFADYANWRSSKGISNSVYAMEDIVLSYPGTDAAEKLRNFIIHVYQTWASSSEPLQYVILGGDDEIVPERGAFGQVGDTMDLRMPADIYYSNLDGNWNANSNDIWGEISDNTDLIPEVHIGRFPAQTQTEFDNMFRKIQYYADNNTFSNNLAVFMGENLNWAPVTWGGDYKDDVAQYLPNSYVLQTLYQRDGTYSESGVWNAINRGAGIMNHMGHANESLLIGQSNSSIENLQNTEYGFLYSQGCYPAAFDQRTSGDAESIAEHMVTTGGGLHSFIGNTRYGWYMPGSIEGASQFYDRQFFNGLFQQNQPQLGKALTYSRLQNLNSAMSDDVMRWCYFEVVLFGDPSLSVKAADPNMPMLSMDSYSYIAETGNDSNGINPGEVIRFCPVISNAMGAGTAQNVTLSIESLPAGVQQLSGCISIPQIFPGGISPLETYIRLELPAEMNFGTYTLKVMLDSQHSVTGLSTGIIRYATSFTITMIDSRFPWETPNAGKSAPLVGDFTSQPGKEIMYIDVYGGGYQLGNNGAAINNFTLPEPMNIMHSFAGTPIDDNYSGLMAFTSRTGDIYGLTPSGAQVFTFQANTAFLWTPVLADINGDGNLDVIAGGLDGKVYAVQTNGTLLPGFPVNLGAAFQSELAAVDFDNDNSFEIVAGTSAGLLYVIGSGGIIRPGFPVQLETAITGSPTLSNSKRIICATASKIYILDSTGLILSSKNIDTHIAGGFALGDVAGDDWGMDVVGISISGKLYAFTDEGIDLPGFPVETGVNFNCPPLLSNLDDDAQLEIILHSYVNSVYGYNHDGSVLNGFPFITTYNGSTPATLVDFDADNKIKMVMGHSNGVLMLNFRRAATGLEPWITYRGSSLRQGSFAGTGFVGSEDNVHPPLKNALLGNYPNPFNPSTTISYSLKSSAPVLLDIYNLKGQKVKTLINGNQPEGKHTAVWDGHDDRGNDVGSGVYLYQLKVNKSSFQQRMLLLK